MRRSGSAVALAQTWKIVLRSEQKHELKYQRYIGDGDSKNFSSIAEKKTYGDSAPIEKIECVGHIQKRMGSHLRKLKALWGGGCLEVILKYHRKEHLKLRNKIKFHPTLPTIPEEEDETNQTSCNSPYLPPSAQSPNNIPSLMHLSLTIQTFPHPEQYNPSPP
ncbi:hypothetical protein TNCV_2834421 [Trichonephila clavipes]|nr:hypothetical protein TNCV_2834421 [Trichonephila clavipes]